WAHARRYFHDACPKVANKDSLALQGKHRISAMFKFEKDHAHLSGEELIQARTEKLKPLVDDFFDWCRDKNVLPGSKLAKAFNYCLNHERELRQVLSHPQLVLDNNLAERQVKEWVIGRKNWLFSSSRKGAESLANIKTIAETAKANGLNVEKYLKYLLEHLPNEPILKMEVLEAYLPWNENVQETCKQNFVRQQRTNAQKKQPKAS
ncbi:IS66 family transposase, partial [Streptococcus ovis]